MGLGMGTGFGNTLNTMTQSLNLGQESEQYAPIVILLREMIRNTVVPADMISHNQTVKFISKCPGCVGAYQ